MSIISTPIENRLQPILSVLQAARLQDHSAQCGSTTAHLPFITVSRQPGISTDGFTSALVRKLNAVSASWTIWDRELVEKVAADHHLSSQLVEAIGRSNPTWLEEFIRGLAFTIGPPDELTLYRQVGTTVRALAQVGKAIIIGRGAVNLTCNMPGGVHVRLVAPWGYRVWSLAAQSGSTLGNATEQIKQLEHERELFYRRFWQHQPPSPELFSITLNVAVGDNKHLAESVLPLVEAVKVRAAHLRNA